MGAEVASFGRERGLTFRGALNKTPARAVSKAAKLPRRSKADGGLAAEQEEIEPART